MVRRVYKDGKQYSTETDLINAIKLEWDNIDLDTLKKLSESMNNRIFDVILNQGGSTKY